MTPVPPNSEPDEQTPVLPVPDTEPEREGSAPETGVPADRPHEPEIPAATAPTSAAKPPRKTPAKRAPRTTVPRIGVPSASDADAATPVDAATPAAEAGESPDVVVPAKPVRPAARAPRAPAAPRAAGTRAPAKKKPAATIPVTAGAADDAPATSS